MEEQVVSIYAGTRGFLDDVAVDRVSACEEALLQDIRANGKKILDKIRKDKKLDDALEKELNQYLEGFIKRFVGSESQAA